MSRREISGHLLTPGGMLRGRLRLADGRIEAIDGEPVTEREARADATRPLVLPGFVEHARARHGASPATNTCRTCSEAASSTTRSACAPTSIVPRSRSPR